jgi:hypothetical protein
MTPTRSGLADENPGAGEATAFYGAVPAVRTTGKSTKLALGPPSNILMVAFL